MTVYAKVMNRVPGVKRVKSATNKIQEKMLKKIILNKRGITIFEMLLILGIAVIIMASTFHVAKPQIVGWWNTSIMPFWDNRGTGGF